jgi:predicted permease
MAENREKDLDREIRAHLELEAEERIAEGMSDRGAQYAARRAFGSVTRTREDARAVWVQPWLDRIRQDMRQALRTLRKSPGFTAVAVFTLALGAGANAAMFSVVNGVILEPLGYPDADRLMFLTTRVEGFDQFWVSSPEYFELAEISQSFSVVGAFRTGEANLAALDRPRRVTTAEVNAELLEALAVPPARGRWFRRDDARTNGPSLVMVSHEIWQSAFSGREDVVGQAIDVNGVMREVVGIMPEGFDVVDSRIDVWLPLVLDPSNREEWNRNTHIVHLIGRLADGVSVAQAQAELDALNRSWAERTGATGHVFSPGTHVMQMEPLQDEIVGSARRALWVLQAAVGFILLIACVNLANLLLARADTRRREIAVRAALGAGRRRLLVQFTAEGVVLSLLGSVVGLGLALAGVRALIAVYPGSLPRAAEIAVDSSVLALTVIVAVLTSVVFGLVPLLHLPDRALGRLLTEGATRNTTAPGRSARRALVAAEVAVAVVLVTGAGLMLRTVANLMSVDAGFDRSRLVTFGVGLPAATYPRFAQRQQVLERLMDGLREVPGVPRVSAMSGLPPQRQVNAVWTDIEGYTPSNRPVPIVDYYQTVATGYFETMRVPIVRGRPFQPGDRSGAPVAVVNETFARTFWPGADPVGRQVRSRFGGLLPWMTVIGVARDVKQGGLEQGTGTELYFLLDQVPRIFPGWFQGEWGSGGMNVVLRTVLTMEALQPAVTRVVREADPSLPVIQLRDMDAVLRDSLRRPRMLMHLFSGLAVLALLLAAVGTYGVLSYVVTQQRREIGIRVALGARRDAVLRGVMRQGLTPALIGVAAGVGAAAGLTQMMETLLFGVAPADPVTLAGVAAVITIVSVMACAVPAHRAARVDPITVLRDE